MANKSHGERAAKHEDELARQKCDPFYYEPSGGESIANICLRVKSVIHKLQQDATGLRVIIVAHGGVLKAFHALLQQKRTKDLQVEKGYISKGKSVEDMDLLMGK